MSADTKPSKRADLPNGVLVFASYFPRSVSLGTPAGWEVQVVHLPTNRRLERTLTLPDDEFAVAVQVQKRVDAYKKLDERDVESLADSLVGCEYDACELVNGKCPPHHKAATAPALSVCVACSRPCVGWLTYVKGRRQCWDCFKQTPDFNPTKHTIPAIVDFPVDN